MLRKTFKYLKPLWEGNDNQISLRSFAAFAMIGDFIYELHRVVGDVVQLLSYTLQNKAIDPAVISALNGTMAQVGVLLGVEAALISTLLGMKTYQNTVIGTTPIPYSPTTTVPISSTPPSCPPVPPEAIP